MHIMLRMSAAACILTGMAVGCAQLIGIEDLPPIPANMDTSLPDAAPNVTPNTHVQVTSILVGDTLSQPIENWNLAAAQPYRITHLQSGNDTTCEASRPSVGQGGTAAAIMLAGPAQGRIGLSTYRVQASFDYILVYGLGAPSAAEAND